VGAAPDFSAEVVCEKKVPGPFLRQGELKPGRYKIKQVKGNTS
jgi:hypothetical protein